MQFPQSSNTSNSHKMECSHHFISFSVFGRVNKYKLLICASTNAIYTFDTYIIILFIWKFNGNKTNESNSNDKIRVPWGISGYENKDYASIESMFRGSGFTNVKSVSLCDLTVGLLKKPGTVEAITINGKSVVSGGKKYSPNVEIVISYHVGI